MTAIEKYQALCEFVLRVNPALETTQVLLFAAEVAALTKRTRAEAKPARKARKASVQAESEAA